MYTKDQIEKGIKLAQCWYEGWRLDDMEFEQIMEAIDKA